jgi:hypothetical protein
MITLVMSALILILPVIAVFVVSVYFWRSGVLGRVCLLLVFSLGAVEAHSVIYPKKLLKEKYAQLIK